MVAILNSASTMLDLDTLFSSLRFTQKDSHSTLTLTQTNSIWLKLIHSHSTWWWWPSWILPSWILPSWIQLPPCLIWTACFLLSDSLKKTLTPLWLWLKLIQYDSNSFILTQLDDGGHLELCHLGPCWIWTACFLLSDSLKKTLTPLWLWLKLTQCDSNSFILTQLDDGGHLEFCHLEFGHLGFSYLSFSSQTHSHLPRLGPTICTKKLHSFILTQLDGGSHLEFGHLGFSHLSFSSQTHSHLPRLVPTICTKKTFTHSFWLNLMMAAMLNSTMLDSDTLFSSLRLTQKHSPSTLTLTQTNLIRLKLIHSHSTWWWWPSWIQLPPCWIWTPCFLLSDSLKKTLTPLWLWLKLIQCDSNSFILTQLDDGGHLELCHLGFSFHHVWFGQLVFFSQIHSKRLSLHSDSDSN